MYGKKLIFLPETVTCIYPTYFKRKVQKGATQGKYRMVINSRKLSMVVVL